ncbi:MAG: glycosyltransferase [Proteobacteria bacterium]|nr:glycosyltransferase [Desulfobacula sp.]MBU3950558.1 glycosyltransferase [Pseudomonadota bacterium]MBU4129189.1 glycosyltransferase [Pseudomonadota bacterium]
MDLFNFLLFSLFFLCLGSLFIVFLGYPVFLYMVSIISPGKKECRPSQFTEDPSISLLVVFRNADSLIEKKIENYLALAYPRDKVELVLVSDGSTDGSDKIARACESDTIQFYQFDTHQGKTECLNFGVTKCKGQIILFSDVDAILDGAALKILSQYFNDPKIGGVCGRRVVHENISKIQSGQLKYIQWDTMIKQLELRCGMSITSHDGKIYAIRKKLFTPVEPGVTDDAYISLAIIGQGFKFVFNSDAIAWIKMPSRNTGHELTRRKRIVSTSLNGLRINRKLFNPFKFGLFSIGLFINKVMRRLLPFALILLLLSSCLLSFGNYPLVGLFFWCQVCGYLFFCAYPLLIIRLPDRLKWIRRMKRFSSLGYFFCVGMAGTFLGVISFISGEKIIKWDPIKK